MTALVPDSITEPPEDWPDNGAVGVFPVLVEHVVAEHLWRTDRDTIWLGGNHAGFDIESRHGRTDAKTAWCDPNHPDRLYFAAPQGKFDPSRVDHIAPVILNPDPPMKVQV